MEMNSFYAIFSIAMILLILIWLFFIPMLNDSSILMSIHQYIFMYKYLHGNHFDAFRYCNKHLKEWEILEAFQKNNITYSKLLPLLKDFRNFMKKNNEIISDSIYCCFVIVAKEYCFPIKIERRFLHNLWESDKSGEEVLIELKEKKRMK